MKRLITVLIILLGTYSLGFGKHYPSWGKLKSGKYHVGFRTIGAYDSTRTYQAEKGIEFRPMLIHVWYPTSSARKDYMPYKSYIKLETQRENFANSDYENYCQQIMQAYINFGEQLMENLNISAEEILLSPTASLHKATPTKGKFPLIIYSPSFGKSSIQNNIACEYLASHGYVVASVASAGEKSQTMTTDSTGILAQVADMKFLINYLKEDSQVDSTRIGSFGYSWGTCSSIMYQMRNKDLQAVASWDGSIEYHGYGIAQKITGFNPDELSIPYIFFSNKKEDYTDFSFYQSIPGDKKHLYRMMQFGHAEFTSYWTHFANVKEKASEYDTKSYRLLCAYTLAFFNTYLKDGKSRFKNIKKSNRKLITVVNFD